MLIAVAGAVLFGVFAFAVTRFGYKQDWRWAVFAGLFCASAVLALFLPIQTHAVKIVMPSGR
jgi:hypothetical protein